MPFLWLLRARIEIRSDKQKTRFASSQEQHISAIFVVWLVREAGSHRYAIKMKHKQQYDAAAAVTDW